jgi:hypothetical protein
VYGIPVRTLDALHLASIEFLRARGQTVELASFDNGWLSLRMPSLFPCMSGDARLDLRRRDHGADPLLLTW